MSYSFFVGHGIFLPTPPVTSIMKIHQTAVVLFVLFFLNWAASQPPIVAGDCPYTKDVQKCIYSGCNCVGCTKKYKRQYCMDLTIVPFLNLTKYNCTRDPSCSTTNSIHHSTLWMFIGVCIIAGIIIAIILLCVLYDRCCHPRKRGYEEL